MRWEEHLSSVTIEWLLESDNPPVRYMTLRDLLDSSDHDSTLVTARVAVMEYAPIQASLDAQYPEGFWVKPGPGYSPKYRATVWQVIFLEQMRADGCDPRVRRACEYVLEHTQTESGGFGCSGVRTNRPPPPSRVLHCLNGNLVRALLGLGWWGDERLTRAIEWQSRCITGEGDVHYYKSGSSGPGFACAANGGEQCAWGAIKALRGLARVPADRRSPRITSAIQKGLEYLLSRDPVEADYPSADGHISSFWFKLGFPSGYVADVLQNLEVLVELGVIGDGRLRPALEWLLSKKDAQGRWRNEYAYNGKLWADVEHQGQQSKWVTLRALRVLKAMNKGGLL
jgi:hypothetical protein